MLLRKKDVEVAKNGILLWLEKNLSGGTEFQADEPPWIGASTQRRRWQRWRRADGSPHKEHTVASDPIERVVMTHGG